MWLRFNIIGLVTILLTITGCDKSNSRDDLELFIIQTKNLTKKNLEPILVEMTAMDYKFLGKEKRDPFVISKEYTTDQVDAIRSKEILEQYDLQKLKMVGTFKKDDGIYWGLVKDSGNVVYKIKIGNYIGRNFGKVVDITEKYIKINESVFNNYSGWIANSVIMKLED